MGAHAIMADVNTNIFDDEETVENPKIPGGQKIPKRLPLHLLDDLRKRTSVTVGEFNRVTIIGFN